VRRFIIGSTLAAIVATAPVAVVAPSDASGGVGVFAAISRFDIGAAEEPAALANTIITDLAFR